ncbi:MAG: carbohydrate kinase family protein [Candidatus Limivicinus sp.]
MTDVAAFGELLIDFTCVSTDSQGYPTMAAHPGGAPANFLAALSRLGAGTALIGKVGADAFGRMLIGTLKKAGIETRGIVSDNKVFTTLAFVSLDEKGDREFSFARKPGADTCISFDEADLSLIDEAKVFHFGSLSLTSEPARSATRQLVEYAKAGGKLISYDPNLRKPLWDNLDTAAEQLRWGLGMADVVKISDEEVKFLFDMSPAEGAAHIIDKYGAKLVFVTCGAEGCWFSNKRASGMVPALEGIKPVDTTGAGDIFGGSAMWKLLRKGRAPEELGGDELRDIVSFACAAAGLSTTKPGGISSVPGPEELAAALKTESIYC